MDRVRRAGVDVSSSSDYDRESMAQRLSRLLDQTMQQIEDNAKIGRIILDVEREHPDEQHDSDQFQRAGVTQPGDPARLRGVPCIGRVAGAIRGTVPHR